MRTLPRRCRSGRPTLAATAALGLVLAFAGASSADEAPTKEDVAARAAAPGDDLDWRRALTPPALLGDAPVGRPHVEMPVGARDARRGAALLPLDLSLHYLHLAVHGDNRVGLSPFVGTSTTSLGGLRLRF